MNSISSECGSKYDVIHFEALGPEAEHLETEIRNAIHQGMLQGDHSCLIVPETLQAFLINNPTPVLPKLVTIKTHSVIPQDYLSGKRKSIITRSAGYDHLEHLVGQASIASLREYCVNAVAQTAMKFIYAAAGLLNHYSVNSLTFERKQSAAFMELGSHRVLTVFGVGRIGKRIHDLARANGLSVRGVDLRQDMLLRLYNGEVEFVSREEAISTSDIVVNAMNLTRDPASPYYSAGYFSREYLNQATKELIFINVTRGEIAPEDVLLDQYESGRIAGLGLDVFSDEAEFAQCMIAGTCHGGSFAAARTLIEKALERSANIYVQPHQGFNSDIAARTKAAEAVRHVISWYANKGRCFDEQLPYY